MQPSEIRSREFDVAVRGYDRVEVRNYLGEVADLVDELSKVAAADSETDSSVRTSVLGTELDDSRVPVGHFAWIGEETKRILEEAQSSAETIREKLIEEARMEARQKAQAEINALNDKIARLHKQVDSLRKQREELASTLRRVLEATEDSV